MDYRSDQLLDWPTHSDSWINDFLTEADTTEQFTAGGVQDILGQCELPLLDVEPCLQDSLCPGLAEPMLSADELAPQHSDSARVGSTDPSSQSSLLIDIFKPSIAQPLHPLGTLVEEGRGERVGLSRCTNSSDHHFRKKHRKSIHDQLQARYQVLADMIDTTSAYAELAPEQMLQASRETGLSVPQIEAWLQLKRADEIAINISHDGPEVRRVLEQYMDSHDTQAVLPMAHHSLTSSRESANNSGEAAFAFSCRTPPPSLDFRFNSSDDQGQKGIDSDEDTNRFARDLYPIYNGDRVGCWLATFVLAHDPKTDDPVASFEAATKVTTLPPSPKATLHEENSEKFQCRSGRGSSLLGNLVLHAHTAQPNEEQSPDTKAAYGDYYQRQEWSDCKQMEESWIDAEPVQTEWQKLSHSDRVKLMTVEGASEVRRSYQLNDAYTISFLQRPSSPRTNPPGFNKLHRSPSSDTCSTGFYSGIGSSFSLQDWTVQPRKGRRTNKVSGSGYEQHHATILLSSRVDGGTTTVHYSCTYCAKSFSSSSAWQRHELAKHTPQNVWVCKPLVRDSEGNAQCIGCTKYHNDRDCEHETKACWGRDLGDRMFTPADSLTQHYRGRHRMGWTNTAFATKFQYRMPPELVRRYDLRCHMGFCTTLSESLQERFAHIGAHFAAGETMARWGRPLEDETYNAYKQRIVHGSFQKWLREKHPDI